MALIYNLASYRAAKERDRQSVAASKPANLVTTRQRQSSRFLDTLVLTLFGLGWIISYPLACWTVIELVRIAWGHPAWHAGACFTLLVGIYTVPVFYTPKTS